MHNTGPQTYYDRHYFSLGVQHLLIDKTKPSTLTISFNHINCVKKNLPSSDRWITAPEVMQLLCFMLQAVIFSNNYIVVWPALPQMSCYKGQEQPFDQYLKGYTQLNFKLIWGCYRLLILKGDLKAALQSLRK